MRKKDEKIEVIEEFLAEICRFINSQSGCVACEKKGNPNVCDESMAAIYKCYLASL